MNAQMIHTSLLRCNEGQLEGLPSNPRYIKDEKFELLKRSLQESPEMLHLRELLVYPHGDTYIVIGGNMRLRAAEELGIEELPCKVLPATTPVEKLREYTIKDNNGYGDYDWDILANEWDEMPLADWGVDMPAFEVEEEGEEADGEIGEDGTYTSKVEAPIYEPKAGAQIKELFDSEKYNTLCEAIRREQLPKDIEQFLLLAATRHIKFDYSKIADYYA